MVNVRSEAGFAVQEVHHAIFVNEVDEHVAAAIVAEGPAAGGRLRAGLASALSAGLLRCPPVRIFVGPGFSQVRDLTSESLNT